MTIEEIRQRSTYLSGLLGHLAAWQHTYGLEAAHTQAIDMARRELESIQQQCPHALRGNGYCPDCGALDGRVAHFNLSEKPNRLLEDAAIWAQHIVDELSAQQSAQSPIKEQVSLPKSR